MDSDDWFFESIKKYKNLSMYDMPQYVTAMDWVSGESLCLGTSNGQKHEILELSLPDKMLADENLAKLKKDRDFQVHTGGFSSNKIVDLKHIPESRYCVTASERSTCVTFWEMGNADTDLMKEHKTFTAMNSTSTPTKIAVNKSETKTHVCFGSTLNNITILDADVMMPVRDTSGIEDKDAVSSLIMPSEGILLTCTHVGGLCTFDLRSSTVPVVHHKKQTHHHIKNSYWTMTSLNNQSNCLLQVSSSLEALVYDTRNLESFVKQFNLSASQIPGVGNYLQTKANPDGSKFSVSGLDGNVYVYNSPLTSSKNQLLEPVFTHDGHMMNCDNQTDSMYVLSHLWHPWQQDLIISTANDCSLHAWQYNS